MMASATSPKNIESILLEAEKENYVLVAAIDFGTAFSGYAFSFKSNPTDIKMNKNWTAFRGLSSYKTPTSVLLTDQGDFKGFGFNAERDYAKSNEDGFAETANNATKQRLLLFRHFKMALNTQKELGDKSIVTAIGGQYNCSAKRIVAHALKYLKEHMLDAISKSQAVNTTADMVRWVITVPAMWSKESIHFMREAAVLAGCVKSVYSPQLVIALEPEVASMCCRRKTIANYPDGTQCQMQKGCQYLTIDCGGGTIDYTAHELVDDETVDEIYKASGGDWGATRVDDNFITLLKEVFSGVFIEAYIKTQTKGWFELLTAFENEKKYISTNNGESLSLPLPYSFIQNYMTHNKFQNITQMKRNVVKSSMNTVDFDNGYLVITNKIALALLTPIVNQIIQHTSWLLGLHELKQCRTIFLVGGFSDCEVLQEQMIQEFQQRNVQILIPLEAQLSVLKGAVLFGYRPQEIRYRKRDDEHVATVAIHLGLNFCCMGLCFRNDTDTARIVTFMGEHGQSKESRLSSTLCLTKYNRIASFGKVKEIPGNCNSDKDQQSVYSHFPSVLNNEDLNSDTIVKADQGSSVCLAKVLISRVLEFFKRRLDSVYSEMSVSKDMIDRDLVRWLLVVPSNVSMASERFLRMCALRASLISQEDSPKLITISEPVAVAFYCLLQNELQDIPPMLDSTNLISNDRGKYIMIDVNMTSTVFYGMRVLGNGSIRNAYTSHELRIVIRVLFFGLFVRLFGRAFLEAYEQEFPEAWNTWFENIKPLLHHGLRENLANLRFHVERRMLGTFRRYTGDNITVENAVNCSGLHGICLKNGYLSISKEQIANLLQPLTHRMTAVLKELVIREDLQPCRGVFFVGECRGWTILRTCFKQEFGSSLEILNVDSDNGELDALKGALRYGSLPYALF